MRMRVRMVLAALALVGGRDLGYCQKPAQKPAQKPPQTATPQRAGWNDKWRLSVNGGAQVTPSDFSQSGTFDEFQEEGSFTAAYELKTAPSIDASLAYRVRGNLGLGVAVSFLDGDTSVNIQGQIPHPFFFNQPRAVSGSQNLKRRETGVHVLLVYLFPVGDKIDLMLSGGPSAIIVEQDVVDDINYTHEFPYDAAVFESAVVRQPRTTAPGVNAGADLTWKLGPRFGVGALIRYSWARATLDASDRNSVSIDAGGLAAGGGLRVFF